MCRKITKNKMILSPCGAKICYNNIIILLAAFLAARAAVLFAGLRVTAGRRLLILNKYARA